MTIGEKMVPEKILKILTQFYSKEEIEWIKKELENGKITVLFKPAFDDVRQGYHETDNGLYIDIESCTVILMTPDGNIPLLKNKN
jgi:hypothetical protein